MRPESAFIFPTKKPGPQSGRWDRASGVHKLTTASIIFTSAAIDRLPFRPLSTPLIESFATDGPE